MLDGTSFRFILGFLAILAFSFGIFIAIGHYKETQKNSDDCCNATVEANL